MAEEGWQRFQRSSPEWAWRFRVLEARSALWQAKYEDVLRLLASRPGAPDALGLKTSILSLELMARARLKPSAEVDAQLEEAARSCATVPDASCGEVLQVRGLMLKDRGQTDQARADLDRSLLFARAHKDSFLESSALLNLGSVLLDQERFDEAMERSEDSYQLSNTIGAKDIALVAQGNLGWAYYKLGDYELALQKLQAAEKSAADVGDISNQENFLTDLGYVYMDQRKFELAAQSFQKALALAEGIKAQQHIYNALRVSARFSLLTGDVAKASEYAQRALDIARQDKNRCDELYPMLVQADLAAHRGDGADAETKLIEIENEKGCPVFLKLEAEHSRALLYASEGRFLEADQQFHAALATFEGARDSIRRSKLSFFANASRIYDDYIHFLVAQKRNGDALRWADHSRARTLAEGLGALPAGKSTEPSPLHAQAIARRAGGTLLFYWLGEKQSLLWVITARKTSLFTLPAGSIIEAAVERYRAALVGPHDVLESADDDGQLLYRMLITPAQSLLPKDAKVFILPDGKLNNLNFETLLVPAPKLHFWIEDVTIANASSLLLLGASSSGASDFGTTKHNRSLLLIGNSLPPNDKYPPLPKAGAQMDAVARHFSQAQWKTLTGAEATPQAYLDGHPELFSHIHFVAHGIASRLSPLDSAIVLSSRGAESDSFKLYARDILLHPLRAELVTVSACYGAGGPSYSGEGLVGLSWAFLRAGAHNVIAALWEVTDASTPQLMDQFYHGIERGESPDAALRAAKLALLHDSRFHNPFYWAPFQFYVGSRAGSKSTNHAQTSAALAP